MPSVATRSSRLCHLLVTLLFPALAVAEAPLRTWSDASGKFSVEASFTGLKEGKVSLRKADGTTIEVALERLSAADQQHARETNAKKMDAKPVQREAWTVQGASRSGPLLPPGKITFDYNSFRAGNVAIDAKEGQVLVLVNFEITANEADKEALRKLAELREPGVLKLDQQIRSKLSRGAYRLFDTSEIFIIDRKGNRTNPVWVVQPVATSFNVVGNSITAAMGSARYPWIEAGTINGRLTALLAIKKKASVSLLFSVPSREDIRLRLQVHGVQEIEID